ncbi:hypothetical protein [Lamprobacter modestohalophilus]|nr:hypothetical protein [Lamprobacter modestohalophilus]
MKTELLELEMQLLLLRYSEDQVLRALAEAQSKPLEEIQRKVTSLREKKHTAKTTKPAKKSISETVEELAAESPNRDLLIELAAKYENKRFLPELKDVKRFAEKSGISGSMPTRESSAKRLFTALLGFERNQLEGILSESPGSGESAFSQLSRQLIEGSSE